MDMDMTWPWTGTWNMDMVCICAVPPLLAAPTPASMCQHPTLASKFKMNDVPWHMVKHVTAESKEMCERYIVV